jgi:hypothetical protein
MQVWAADSDGLVHAYALKIIVMGSGVMKSAGAQSGIRTMQHSWERFRC